MGDDIPLGNLRAYRPHDIETAAAKDPETILIAKEERQLRERALEILDSLPTKSAILIRARFGIVTPAIYSSDQIYDCVREGYERADEKRRAAFVAKCEDPKNEALYVLVHGSKKTHLPDMTYKEVAELFDINFQSATMNFQNLRSKLLREGDEGRKSD